MNIIEHFDVLCTSGQLLYIIHMSFDCPAFIDDLPTYEPPFVRGFPAKTGRAVLKSPRSGLKRRPKIRILPPVLFIGWYYWVCPSWYCNHHHHHHHHHDDHVLHILVCIYICIIYHFCPTSVSLYVNYTDIIYIYIYPWWRYVVAVIIITDRDHGTTFFGAPIWPNAAAAGKTPTVVLPKLVRNTTFYRGSLQLALRLFI